MQVLDLQHGAENGLSISPTANTSADQTGLGVDLGQGTLVGHVILAVENLQDDLVVHVQEAADDVAEDYETTATWTVGTEIGTDAVDLPIILQFTRNNRWARVKVIVGSNVNIRLSAILTSMLQGDGGGVSTSPAS